MLNAFGITASGGGGTNNTVTVTIKCSPPSGITARGGLSSQGMVGRAYVLNAFRHHGERRTPPMLPTPSPTRAQRLAASRRATGPRLLDSHRGYAVLNAFRHHGERRRKTAVALDRYGRVRNAFRQRGERRLHDRIREGGLKRAQRLKASRRAAAPIMEGAMVLTG
ncbi:hypothetical protein [Myxococcus qinghaiensis]|uniref:hypothetical protein n=1 Tax=Myxococcus qinghaiensis TaxID=2906758 RepID=UPI0020A6EB93|nr:hypothetical protein [Myxococcus qinghaiensis]MCP3166897.1 hypothetical protein [Myxococcus qinghaiensis]